MCPDGKHAEYGAAGSRPRQGRGEARNESAEGPNAVVRQHELDHLDGALQLDRLVGDLLPIEEMRRRREEAGRR